MQLSPAKPLRLRRVWLPPYACFNSLRGLSPTKQAERVQAHLQAHGDAVAAAGDGKGAKKREGEGRSVEPSGKRGKTATAGAGDAGDESSDDDFGPAVPEPAAAKKRGACRPAVSCLWRVCDVCPAAGVAVTR